MLLGCIAKFLVVSEELSLGNLCGLIRGQSGCGLSGLESVRGTG